jgi:FixJ family two-component response regulator
MKNVLLDQSPMDLGPIARDLDSLYSRRMESQRPYIAVVDDDLSIRKALLRLLRTADLEAVAFACGEDFLRSVSGHRPDCLVLDVHLQGIDGLHVQDQLGSLGYAIPIVFITAQDDRSTRQRAMAGGAAAYLQKPLSSQDLLEAIGGITRRNDNRRQTSVRPI